MRTTSRRLGLPVAALFLLAGCSSQPAGQEDTSDLDSLSHDELVARAQEEGRVVVYSFTSRIATIEEEFEAAYPGIDVVATDISSTEQITRLASEHQAGSATADVVYVSDAPVVIQQLIEPGILLPYLPPRVADVLPAQYQEPVVANRLSTKVLMYNEESHPEGSPVSNLWELTEEEWNGRVIMVDPLQRGDYLDLLTEFSLRAEEFAEAYREHTGAELRPRDGIENAGQQFIADLYANDLVLVDSTDAVNAAVGDTGQASPPVGFTSYSDRRDNEDEGRALQVAQDVSPSAGIVFPALLGTTASAENPAAARLLIDFMMGDDSPDGGPAYAPFYVPGDYPTRTDIEPPSDALSLEELGAWDIDPQATADARSEIADFLLTVE